MTSSASNLTKSSWLFPESVARATMYQHGRRQYGPLSIHPSIKRSDRRHIPYCTEAYDEDHIRLFGYNCMNRHRVYNWPSTCSEKYLLIGDSLVKYLLKCRHMRVVSLPGAGAYQVFTRLHSNQIRLENYTIICLAIGTNDVANMDNTPTYIADTIMMLLWFIKRANPTAIVAYSGMLIRPKDLGTFVEYRRHLVNSIIQKLCKAQNVRFLKAWKCLMTGSNVRDRTYARDGLHLNRSGARHIYRYLKGNITNFEGQMRL